MVTTPLTLLVIFDDSTELKINIEATIVGYLFFHETSPLRLSNELLERLSNEFAVQRKKIIFDIPSLLENFFEV